jgi:hypothetical protein
VLAFKSAGTSSGFSAKRLAISCIIKFLLNFFYFNRIIHWVPGKL